MIKLLKFLKQSLGTVLIIIALLVIQAICDLSLPGYTSNIVDIGIRNNGISDTVPKVLMEEQIEGLALFVPESDLSFINDCYEKINANSDDKLVKKYSKIKEYGGYKLKDLDKETKENLIAVMEKPLAIYGSFATESDQTKEMKDKIVESMKQMGATGVDFENVSLLELIKSMPSEMLKPMLSKMTDQFDKMPSEIISPMSKTAVREIYQKAGLSISKAQNQYLLITGSKMLGIALVAMISLILVCYLAARVAAKIGRDLRSQVFRKVVSFSNTEMDKFSTASLITRSTNDIQQVQMLTVLLLRMVFYAPILGLGGVFKVMRTGSSMTWIIALAVGVIVSIVAVLYVVAMPKFKKMQTLVDNVNLVTREILTGIPVIRAFSTEKHEEERFDKANKDLTKNMLFTNRVMTFMMPLMMFVMNCVTILIVWVGAKSIDAGTTQVGEMMAFIQYTMMIVMSFLMLTMMSIMLPRASVSAKRVDEILSTELSIIDPQTDKKEDINSIGVVEFDNVSFKYPNADENVLSDISFVAKPGETTAFIGSTGSGKSTLVNLIPRFYDVTEGAVKIDGIDVRDLSQHTLRDKLGYVPQKGVLFSGTISTNINYGNKDISMDDIEKAAYIAQAKDFIDEKSEKYDSDIAQGGGNVSGGQKQRLSIARAIARRPEVYIFDDSFSALDYKTDVALRKALKQETANSTVLIVAQRISTIIHADQIIVIDEGKIVGKGTHKELLKSNEIYQQIAMSQLSKEELANG